jgi:hypothetical protein
VSDLARHIAVAAHAAALTRDLLHSRESLVIAREEERRRIRRDLHDGLGPALAGIAFGIDAARKHLARDPAATDAALAELKAEVQTSVADVRRLVYDLRPPALDQLGLVPAVREYGARLVERGALSVTVSAARLPPLPAAVEVAAYRIAIEALTNAARHSHARTSSVSFEIDDSALRLQVDDDGDGVPAAARVPRQRMGMSAMAERAAELGGPARSAPGPVAGLRSRRNFPCGHAMTRTRVIVADEPPDVPPRTGGAVRQPRGRRARRRGSGRRGRCRPRRTARTRCHRHGSQHAGVNGVEATRRILGANPDIAVLVLTMLDEDESVFAAMRAGCRGYVVKGADTEDVLRALESVARGDAVFGPAIAEPRAGLPHRPLSARDPILFPETVRP